MNAEQRLADAITERAVSFFCGSVRYHLYPPSLGVYLMSRALIEALGVDTGLLMLSGSLELLRIAKQERATAMRLIALHTLKGYQDLHDEGKIAKRIAQLEGKLDTSDIAKLMAVIFSLDGYDELIEAYGLKREQEERERVARVKGDGSMVSFGGRTLYGGLLDFVCQRYGWTMHYCVWDISYTNLRMMSADASISLYLSDDERKRIVAECNRINGDDPSNSEAIANFLREHNGE